MTIDQFNKTKWSGQMKCEYDGKIFTIMSVDFKELLIGIDEFGQEFISWKRCENIHLIKNNKHHE